MSPTEKSRWKLLRMASARPCRSNPVVDSLERKGGATVGVVRRNAALGRNQGRPVAIRLLLHGPPEQVGVEPAELSRIRAVQDDQVENGVVGCWVSRPSNVNVDPDDRRPDFQARDFVCASYPRFRRGSSRVIPPRRGRIPRSATCDRAHGVAVTG